MTQSHTLQLHIEQLTDLRGILHSLKNMAFMEIHKLARFQRTQTQVIDHIEAVMGDFLHFYPDLLEKDESGPEVVIVVGSERGFCGNFNESLIEPLSMQSYSAVIAVGNRLCGRLQNANVSCITVPGANGGEEIAQVLSQLIDAVVDLPYQQSLFRLSVLFHNGEHARVSWRKLLPPPTNEKSIRHPSHPLLTLPPAQFLFELIDQYLLGALQNILYASLAAENNQRLRHLDDAVNHLDEKTARLRQLSQIHRQEEITEEIEVILLNAENQGF